MVVAKNSNVTYLNMNRINCGLFRYFFQHFKSSELEFRKSAKDFWYKSENNLFDGPRNKPGH